jgi:hypothetical protein
MTETTDASPFEPPTFTVRAGSNGEALVTAPSGRMEFISLWGFFKFCFQACRAGHKIKVQDR